MAPRICFVVMFLGLAVLYPLQRWMDTASPRQVVSDETLFFSSGPAIKRMSLGLDGLVADIYWMRAVQYFGNKVIAGRYSGAGGDAARIDLLAPLLNIIVDLDPHHITAYRFGAIFLPEQDPQAAIDLLNKGIERNPDDWHLYQDLGFIYWHMGDYAKAAEVYDQGSNIEGSLWWMRDLAGFMRVKGGSRDAAREVYEHYLNSDDPTIRSQAVFRLRLIHSLDEVDAINRLLSRYKSETGRCPSDLKVLARWLQPAGVPLNDDLEPVDADGFPLVLDQAACTVAISPSSDLPRSL
ncbi:MAG TPA: tetratricopeptide repeat protein [Blastocatellia bacterium]